MVVNKGWITPSCLMAFQKSILRHKGFSFYMAVSSVRSIWQTASPLLCWMKEVERYFSARRRAVRANCAGGHSPWRIIGIARKPGPKMSSGFVMGWVPYSSLQQRVVGDKPIEFISLRFPENLTSQQAELQVERLLLREHGKDFY